MIEATWLVVLEYLLGLLLAATVIFLSVYRGNK